MLLYYISDENNNCWAPLNSKAFDVTEHDHGTHRQAFSPFRGGGVPLWAVTPRRHRGRKRGGERGGSATRERTSLFAIHLGGKWIRLQRCRTAKGLYTTKKYIITSIPLPSMVTLVYSVQPSVETLSVQRVQLVTGEILVDQQSTKRGAERCLVRCNAPGAHLVGLTHHSSGAVFV